MIRTPRQLWTVGVLSVSVLVYGQGSLTGQESSRLFPDRSLMPTLLAGSRDPVTSASLLAVSWNPNAHGRGIEAEVSLGTTFPVLLLAGEPTRSPLVVGVEAAVFGRFRLQVIERELIASDWLFAIPGINLSRDAGELLVFHRPLDGLGVYGAARYRVNVHPK